MCLILTNRAAEGPERSEFIIPAREPRVVLGNCKIGCPIFLSFFLSFFEYIAWFSANDVMGHFVFPGKFTIGESRATSVQMTQNSKPKTLHGILAGEDFPSKLLWRTPTKIHRERKRRRQQGNGEAERASLAQRRQRRQHSDHNMYRGSDKILQLHCK